MSTNDIPDWIVVPKRYKLVNYSRRWYDLESLLFFHLEYGKFPDLGPGYRVESMGWGTGSYRIYKTSKLPINKFSDFEPELIHIPACEYWMDEFSENSQKRDPTRKKLIKLDEYWIGRIPVTIKQFSYFIDNYGYRTTEEIYRSDSYIWSSPNGNVEEIESNPKAQVTFVSIRDIDAYCNWLGKITGKKYGLPSVAEWENAYSQLSSAESFVLGEWDEWTADYEDVVIGYDPECTGEPIYYKNKRMYHLCGGIRSIYPRGVSFGVGKNGFRVVVRKP
jgi:hypothetical protein